jgi:hypothetical protein
MYSFTCILPLPKYNGETRPNPKWSYFPFGHKRPAMPDLADVCLCDAAIERPAIQSWSV